MPVKSGGQSRSSRGLVRPEVFSVIFRGKRCMILSLSEDANDAMLDSLATMMDGGTLEMLSDDDDLLVSMPLANPVAGPAVDATLEFNSPISPAIATLSGQAATARIVAADDTDVLTCDIGDENQRCHDQAQHDAIFRGEPVRLGAFTLKMP